MVSTNELAGHSTDCLRTKNVLDLLQGGSSDNNGRSNTTKNIKNASQNKTIFLMGFASGSLRSIYEYGDVHE